MSEQKMLALRVANGKRFERSRLRADLRSGRVTVAEVLRERPACLHGLTVLDVIRLGRGGTIWQRDLGRRAVRDGVNLLVRIEDASERTLVWAAEQSTRPRDLVAA